MATRAHTHPRTAQEEKGSRKKEETHNNKQPHRASSFAPLSSHRLCVRYAPTGRAPLLWAPCPFFRHGNSSTKCALYCRSSRPPERVVWTVARREKGWVQAPFPPIRAVVPLVLPYQETQSPILRFARARVHQERKRVGWMALPPRGGIPHTTTTTTPRPTKRCPCPKALLARGRRADPPSYPASLPPNQSVWRCMRVVADAFRFCAAPALALTLTLCPTHPTPTQRARDDGRSPLSSPRVNEKDGLGRSEAWSSRCCGGQPVFRLQECPHAKQQHGRGRVWPPQWGRQRRQEVE